MVLDLSGILSVALGRRKRWDAPQILSLQAWRSSMNQQGSDTPGKVLDPNWPHHPLHPVLHSFSPRTALNRIGDC